MVGKDCYVKYCGNCLYCVKAYWEPKQGFKYGWMGIECCANGGKYIDSGQPICPNGIGWDVCLGEAEDFDPEMIWVPSLEMIEAYKILEGMPRKAKWWNEE